MKKLGIVLGILVVLVVLIAIVAGIAGGSYNRLVNLYLERLRLSGDAADARRAELAASKSLELAPNAYASIMAMARVRLA